METHDCYSVSFTELLTYGKNAYESSCMTILPFTAGVSQPPEFDVFPDPQENVLLSDQLILHAELTTTTDRITAFWQHGDTIFTDFIFEDPFCDKRFEVSQVPACSLSTLISSLWQECRNDTHPDARPLRQQRIRAYRTTRIIRLEGCQTANRYRLETYLMVDNVGIGDAGQYTFNLTATHSGYTGANVARSTNVSISRSYAADCLCVLLCLT